MRKYEITFNEKFEAIMPTPIVLNQSDSNFLLNCRFPKSIVKNCNVTTAYIQFTLPCEERNIQLKFPEGLNASLETEEKDYLISVNVSGRVTEYYGGVKCSLILKRELTEEEKLIELEAAIEDELDEDELPTTVDVETISSSIFYLFVRETNNYKRKIHEEDEDVVLVEIQKMIDDAQAVLKRVKNNVKKLDMTFTSYHDFASACIEERKQTNTKEIYIGVVNRLGYTNTVIGIVSLNNLQTKYQAMVLSGEGRVIVSDGSSEKTIKELNLENTDLYNTYLKGETVVDPEGILLVPSPNEDNAAVPKWYVDKATTPFVGNTQPSSTDYKVWFDTSDIEDNIEDNADIDLQTLNTYTEELLETEETIKEEHIEEKECNQNELLREENNQNQEVLLANESSEILIDSKNENTEFLIMEE